MRSSDTNCATGNFFRTEPGWGVIPAWGFAKVLASAHPSFSGGERVYGFLPMATHARMRPERKGARVIDHTPHRSILPATYNAYSVVGDVPLAGSNMEDLQALLLPMFATSYALFDALLREDFRGADQIVVTSASAKTATGFSLALATNQPGPGVIGLTSPGNVAHVRSVGAFDTVVSYDEISAIDVTAPTVIVDFAGNGALLTQLLNHLQGNLRHTVKVGMTHINAASTWQDDPSRNVSTFFVPSYIEQRMAEEGSDEILRRIFTFWQTGAVASHAWLTVQHVSGMAGLVHAYKDLLGGIMAPNIGIIALPLDD